MTRATGHVYAICAICDRRRMLHLCAGPTAEFRSRYDPPRRDGQSVAQRTFPAGTPVCSFHELLMKVECCGQWAASHLSIPCGAERMFNLSGDRCGQCLHLRSCCGKAWNKSQDERDIEDEKRRLRAAGSEEA